MESKRQQKFARLIQKDLGEIFQRESRNLFNGAFITVTQVRMSPDLGTAKVFLSFLMEKDKEALLENIKSNTPVIRKSLGERIRKQVRVIPVLYFYIDDTQEYAARIDSLLNNLDIPPKEEEEEK
ncbi:MAG: 30S ribosome-binding factor RbfA [Cytophagaceae bacterium]